MAYGLGVGARNLAFDRSWKRTFRPTVPVISVGNVTAGGTGKTPFVAFLANWFRERGVKVVLLSRGYRSIDGEANDEKRVLDQLCPGVPHLQNRERAVSALIAIREHGAQLLILDDAFQHRRVARDLDVVLIDALNPWGYGHLLPRGLLREPVGALRRASLIAITRVDQASREDVDAIMRRAQSIAPDVPVIEVAYPPERLVNSAGERAEFADLNTEAVSAFCGIGNPAAFQQTLADAGFKIAAFRAFPDHHHYTIAELNELAAEAEKVDAMCLVTTQKDLVKINANEVQGIPLWAVQIGAKILRGREHLDAALEGIQKRI